MKVKNRGCIRSLSIKQLLAAKARNIIAVTAIVLTTLLFTSLFTIFWSINEGFQQSLFRQVGSDFHGAFKNVTYEQMEELCADPLIKEYGARMFLGMASDEPFTKVQVEVSYMDDNCARHAFIEPEQGRLPQESNELATDTRVLSLLGVEPELGAEVHLPFYIDNNTGAPLLIDRTYILSGWWQTNEAGSVSFVNLSRSAAGEIAELSGGSWDTMTGNWSLSVMFKNPVGIRENLEKVLKNHGYQNVDFSEGDSFIATGVNWGYTGASMKLDPVSIMAGIVVLLLIIFTGYLIIYNVFQISVSGDIRFYGLLKTIGTTGRQLRRMIRHQALMLSAAGIPLGLLFGWLAGVKMTPVIAAQLNDIPVVFSANPVIFIAAAVFALITVSISCRKPGRIAGGVSPVEAVRYTEGGSGKKKSRKSTFVSTLSFAWANVGRSKRKTAITVLSLSLAVLLLNLTITFVDSFDMDKFLSSYVVTDFMVGDTNYFHDGSEMWNANHAVPEELIDRIEAQGGIKDGGRTYGMTFTAEEFVSEDYYRRKYGRRWSADELEAAVSAEKRSEDGKLSDAVQLYGMERFCMDKLRLLEGDISKLYRSDGSYIAAVYSDSDTGEIDSTSNWAKLGETITLRYVEEYEVYNPETGEVYPDGTDLSANPWAARAKEYTEKEYEVAALVVVPHPLSYRYYGSDEFVLNAQTFLQDSGSGEGSIMYYACDMADAKATEKMEDFLSDYTGNVNPDFDYESRAVYESRFHGVRKMFLGMGGILCLVIALVGILNFFNAILTGIISRRREFAMLQSVGMTNRQLMKMLAFEGVIYAMATGLLSLILAVLLNPLAAGLLEQVLWFFSYRFTVWPVLAVMPVFLLIGILLPLSVYRFAARQSIVERLRLAG